MHGLQPNESCLIDNLRSPHALIGIPYFWKHAFEHVLFTWPDLEEQLDGIFELMNYKATNSKRSYNLKG